MKIDDGQLITARVIIPERVDGYDIQVEHLIPVWVQRFLDHRCRVGLLTPDGGHGKWIGKSYNDLVSRQRRNNAGRLSKEPDVRNTSRLYNPSAAITAESSQLLC